MLLLGALGHMNGYDGGVRAVSEQGIHIQAHNSIALARAINGAAAGSHMTRSNSLSIMKMNNLKQDSDSHSSSIRCV